MPVVGGRHEHRIHCEVVEDAAHVLHGLRRAALLLLHRGRQFSGQIAVRIADIGNLAIALTREFLDMLLAANPASKHRDAETVAWAARLFLFGPDPWREGSGRRCRGGSEHRVFKETATCDGVHGMPFVFSVTHCSRNEQDLTRMRLTVSTARPTMARDERDVKRQSHRASVRHFSVAGVAALRRTAWRIGAAPAQSNEFVRRPNGWAIAPAPLALTLRGESTQTLGVVVKDFEDPYFGLWTTSVRWDIASSGTSVRSRLPSAAGSLAGWSGQYPVVRRMIRAHHGASADGRNGPAGVRLGGAWRPCRARAGHQRRAGTCDPRVVCGTAFPTIQDRRRKT